MKKNVEDMDAEMEKLRLNMNKISDGSAKINTSLVEKRDRVGQLSGVHGLLKKVSFFDISFSQPPLQLSPLFFLKNVMAAPIRL